MRNKQKRISPYQEIKFAERRIKKGYTCVVYDPEMYWEPIYTKTVGDSILMLHEMEGSLAMPIELFIDQLILVCAGLVTIDTFGKGGGTTNK